MNKKQIALAIVTAIVLVAVFCSSSVRVYHPTSPTHSAYFSDETNVGFMVGGFFITLIIAGGLFFAFRTPRAQSNPAKLVLELSTQAAPVPAPQSEPMPPSVAPVVLPAASPTPQTVIPQALSRPPSVATNDHYRQAAQEIANGSADQGIWARSFAEAMGDEAKTKALYLKNRAEDIAQAQAEALAKRQEEARAAAARAEAIAQEEAKRIEEEKAKAIAEEKAAQEARLSAKEREQQQQWERKQERLWIGAIVLCLLALFVFICLNARGT